MFAIKGHNKLDGIDLHGIPVVRTYCYLGVTVDNCGSIDDHLDRVRQRSSYLRSHMRYYVN